VTLFVLSRKTKSNACATLFWTPIHLSSFFLLVLLFAVFAVARTSCWLVAGESAELVISDRAWTGDAKVVHWSAYLVAILNPV
jgi:hypothetical protein